MTTVDQHQSASEAPSWVDLARADALFTIILLGGALLRLGDLGGPLLRPEEADTALGIWYAWQPAGSDWLAESPAYFTLTSPLTQVLGFGETVMRLVPALAGVVLVAIPWALRAQLSQHGALIASLLLAVSPTAVAAARTVGGTSLALTAGLALLVAFVRYRHSGHTRWLWLGAGCIGFGLATAPLFINVMLALGAGLFFAGRFALAQSWSLPRPSPDSMRRALLIGGGAFVAASTTFLLRPAGFGAALSIVATWVQGFRFSPDVLDWFASLFALGRYEIGLLVMATAAVAWATWRSETLPTLLVYWFSAGLLLAIAQGNAIENVLLLVVPGYLLVGVFIAEQIRGVHHPFLRPGIVVILALIFGAIANMGRHVRTTATPAGPQLSLYLLAALFCLLFAAALMVYASTWQPRLPTVMLLWTGLGVLFLYGWGTSWWLGHGGHNDPRERWVNVGTDPAVRDLVNLLERTARQATGDTTGFSIASGIDTPVLRWYLREQPGLEFTAVGSAGAGDPDVVLTAQATAPSLANAYIGESFGLHLNRPEPVPSPSAIGGLFRWWVFHESDQKPTVEPIVLWLRQDHFSGN